VYQSRIESCEVESPTNLAADEPLSTRRSSGTYHRAPGAHARAPWGIVAHTRPHAFVTVVDPVGSSAVDQPQKYHTSAAQLRAAADLTEIVCGHHPVSHVGSHLCTGQLIATYVAAM
jgi:hypothetical protein